VSVSGATYSDGSSDGYEFRITFNGAQVGGDVPLVIASTPDSAPSAWNITVNETIRGAELTGTFSLAYDDSSGSSTTNYPTPEEQTGEGLATVGSDTTAGLSLTSTESEVKAALESLATLAGTTIGVQKEFTGGPGLSWRITFEQGARARGNRGAFECIPTLSSSTAKCNVTDNVVQGTFLSGTFTLTAGLGGVNQTTDGLPWDISAADLETALENLFPNKAMGAVSAVRTPYMPQGSDDWVGGFQWMVTFNDRNEDV